MVDECRVSCYPVIFFLSHFSIPLYLPLSFLFLFILLLHCPYFKAGWGYATDFGGTDEAYKAEKGISSFVRRRRLTRKQIFYRTFLYNLVCYNYPVPSHVLILLTRSGFLYLHLVIFFALKNAL